MIIAFLLVLSFFVVVNFANCDIIFAPIKGLMFGALYNKRNLPVVIPMQL